MKKIICILLVIMCVTALTLCFVGCNKGQDELVVVTNCPFEPFEYVNTSEGKIYGIDIEIAKDFADSQGLKLVVKDIEFDAIFSQVDSGYADIGMAGITKNEEREKNYYFSDSYFNASQKLIVSEDNTTFDECTTVEEVEALLSTLNVTIGFQTGTTGSMYVQGDEDWGYEGFENITPKSYSTALNAVVDLINGNIYGVVVDEAPAAALVKAFNETSSKKVKLVDVKLTDEVYAFLFQKGNSELQSKFNAYLKEIKENGTFDDIVAKYFENKGTKEGVEINY